MISAESPGARLKAFIEAHWGRSRGGMEGLAQAARLRGRQTLYEWFSGAEPSLASLAQVADALGVRRVDLVAAYDGVIAPEQQETPRPEWAEGLENRIVDAIEERLISVESPLDPVVARVVARLATPPSPDDAVPHEEAAEHQDGADTRQRRSA